MNPVQRIDFINFNFDTNLPHDARVDWLNRKSVIDDKMLETDFVFRSDEELYHIEVESSPGDTNIGIRMWQYARRIVDAHGPKRNLRSRLPDELIVYLRTPEKPWKTVSITLEAPKNQTSMTYEVPCKYISDLVGPNLVQKAFVYAPAMMVNLIGKPGATEKAKEYFRIIRSNLDPMLASGEITRVTYNKIINTAAEYAQNVIFQDVTVTDKRKGWKEMTEAIGYMPPIKRLQQRFKEWGAEEKTLDVIKKMFADNEPIEKIAKYTDLSVEEVEEYIQTLAQMS
jgi:hypothetical protein